MPRISREDWEQMSEGERKFYRWMVKYGWFPIVTVAAIILAIYVALGYFS